MTQEEIEKIINDYCDENRHYETLRIGRYVIQPMYWSEDSKGNIKYDTESMENEFYQNVIHQLEDHNNESDFDWDE